MNFLVKEQKRFSILFFDILNNSLNLIYFNIVPNKTIQVNKSKKYHKNRNEISILHFLKSFILKFL